MCALELRKALFPDRDHQDEAQSLCGVGVGFLSLGRREDVLYFKLRELRIWEVVDGGRDHKVVAALLDVVGIACEEAGWLCWALGHKLRDFWM